jgi:hypothetical protein
MFDVISNDKMESQALGYVPVPGFAAGPMTGQGRWVVYPDGTVLYTDDNNILFAKNANSTMGLIEAVQAIRGLHLAGKTSSEAFEALRGNALPVSGDLSEIT